MRLRSRALTALLVPSCLSGCCSISLGLTALFCGPRTDPFLERSFDTHAECLETFLGAISRDDAETIYRSLSPDLLDRWELVGEVEWELVWREMKERVTGIHLADRAERSEPSRYPETRQNPHGRVSYVLTLPTTRIQVDLREHFFHSVQTRTDKGEKGDRHGAHVKSLKKYLKFGPTEIEARVPAPFHMDLSEFLKFELGREWLIAGFRVLQN